MKTPYRKYCEEVKRLADDLFVEQKKCSHPKEYVTTIDCDTEADYYYPSESYKAHRCAYCGKFWVTEGEVNHEHP